jgi:MFS family permease
VLVGRVVDKHGARPALLGGAVFLAAALLGMAYVSELWHVCLAFPMLGIGFACIHTVTIGKIVSRWFLAKRPRAMASATFGAGFGDALLVPLNILMIQNYGLLGGSLTLIAVSILILVPMALFVIKDGPEVLGQHVDGAAAAAVTAEMPSAAEIVTPANGLSRKL